MASINNLTATTELEAVNEMLAAIGEAPIADVDAATAVDVRMAVNILRGTAKETLQKGWRFNTEFGYEVAPAASYAWSNTAGLTDTLNIFKPPTGLLGYSVNPIVSQQGAHYLDTSIRPSRKYLEAGAPVMVFYDRVLNRDGFDRAYLYINPVWAFDFEMLPETARKYILVKAARKFAQKIVGADALVQFTARDEMESLRDLRREEGMIDNYNLFQNGSVFRHLGGRPSGPSGFFDGRATAGPA